MKRLLIAALAAVLGGMAAQKDQTLVFLIEGGHAAFRQGDFADAQRKFQQAIKILRNSNADSEVLLGIALANLGFALDQQGNGDGAVEALSEALARLSRSLETGDRRTIRVVNGLASIETLRGNLRHAKALFQEVLPTLRERYPTDIELARTLVGLSSLCVIEERFEDARALAAEALRISINSEGETGIDTPNMYNALARAYLAGGYSERALPLYRKAIVLYDRLLGPDNLRSLQVRPYFAWTLLLDGKPVQAENEVRGALQTLARTCPTCYREQWSLEYILGLVKVRQGKLLDADRLLSQVVEKLEAHVDNHAIELAQSLRSLAIVRRKRGFDNEAVRMIKRADDLFR